MRVGAAELLVKERGRRLRPRRRRGRLPRARRRTCASSALVARRRPSSSAGAVARVDGPARAVLTGERTALNLLGRLSGIATLTRRYVDAVEGTGARRSSTRARRRPACARSRSTPSRCGGGTNHRLRPLRRDPRSRTTTSASPAAITAAVERAARRRACRSRSRRETLDEVREALDAGVDCDPARQHDRRRRCAQAVALVAGRAPLEASGGITLDTVRAIAETGVDFISIGALTHSARSLDVSLEVLMSTLDRHDDRAARGGPRARARARRRDPRPQLPGARGAGRGRLRRRLARALARGGARPTRRRSSSAASTSWPRPRRSSRPEKTVLIPDLDAGCSLAASITADQLRAWKAENPGAVVVSYVNTTAEVKAESDYCCTSGNAKAVIEAIPADKEILFLPGHVPRALARARDRPQAAHLDGRVPRPRGHPAATTSSAGRRDAPDAELLVHPECGCASQCMAFGNGRTHILSTEGMVDFAQAARRRSASSSRPRPGSSTGCTRRRPGSASRPSPRRAICRVHEDDHAREAARLAARLEARRHGRARGRRARARRDRADGRDRLR